MARMGRPKSRSTVAWSGAGRGSTLSTTQFNVSKLKERIGLGRVGRNRISGLVIDVGVTYSELVATTNLNRTHSDDEQESSTLNRLGGE